MIFFGNIRLVHYAKSFFVVHCAFALLLFCTSISAHATHAAPVAIQQSADDDIRKIVVLESNNLLSDQRFRQLFLPKTPQSYEIRELREYVRPYLNDSSVSDIKFFENALRWVCMQWVHHSANEPPPGTSSVQLLRNAKQGAQYQCEQYCQVLGDVLTSFGYVSRMVQIWQKDAAYAAPGGAHVVVEAWSNSAKKWVYLDPQWGASAVARDTVCSVRNLYQHKKMNDWNAIEFHVSDDVLRREKVSRGEYLKEYSEFLQMYFGYMVTVETVGSVPRMVVLPMEATQQYLTFQGLPVTGQVFTDNIFNLYFKINQSFIVFDYAQKISWGDLFKQYKIEDEESYMRNMPKFAAKPNYTLTFAHSMPWFKTFEVRIDDGEWHSITGDKYNWDLIIGVNTISVRPVNLAGVKGIPTTMKIAYGTKEELTKATKHK